MHLLLVIMLWELIIMALAMVLNTILLEVIYITAYFGFVLDP